MKNLNLEKSIFGMNKCGELHGGNMYYKKHFSFDSFFAKTVWIQSIWTEKSQIQQKEKTALVLKNPAWCINICTLVIKQAILLSLLFLILK